MIRRRHKRSLTRFIVRLSIGATALSVAVLICATAFVNGFQHAIENKIYSFWGHIRVIQSVEAGTGMMEEMPVDKSNEVEKQLKKINKTVKKSYHTGDVEFYGKPYEVFYTFKAHLHDGKLETVDLVSKT